MDTSTISDRDFARFQALIHELTGISLTPAKKPLLCGRLAKRLRSRQIDSYGDYFNLVTSNAERAELQTCVDLLTTNETYFFREPAHFDFLRNRVLARHDGAAPFRIWSAACSSGEEPYTMAIVLADVLGLDRAWEIYASDISTRVLDRARAGVYPMARAERIPPALLRTYCLKGTGSQDGFFAVDPALRQRVRFMQVNLNAPLPDLPKFDVIFLRNVMIYFELPVKRQVVRRLEERLVPGGWMIIGHSESLNGVSETLQNEAPTIYRRPL